MGFEPLVWYCQPLEGGIWATVTDSAFGAYTPCGIDSVVVCISHLVLLGLCFYRIWLIRNDLKVQRYQLRSKYYNYVLGLLAGYCTAEPLFRLVMGISLFNLEGQTGLAPFEMVSLIIVALAWCSMLVMLGIETGIYIREFRWYVRFGAAYVLVGDAVMLNLILSVTDFYTGLSQLARWLGEKAEELGVEIYPGFAASEILYDDEKVIGIATNDMGIAKDGSRRDKFQCGVEFKGRITLLGEGCRGSLSEVSLGLLVALNYHNPFLNPTTLS